MLFRSDPVRPAGAGADLGASPAWRGAAELGARKVEIGDTGIGIPPEIRDCVFEPFFTTKTQGKGTGLGLSIVRNIVENHHAEIAFTSEPGRGSVFTILFWAT